MSWYDAFRKKKPEEEIQEVQESPVPEDSPDIDEEMEDKDLSQYKWHGRDMNPAQMDDAYNDFKKTYEDATGKSWDKGKFISRAADWVFFGEPAGYITVRVQNSGLYKLTGIAGNGSNREKYHALKNGMEALEAENQPTWGMVADPLKKMAGRYGFRSPPGAIIKMLLPMIPSYTMGGASIKKIGWDGGVTLNYKDVGDATKYFIANDRYFSWMKSNVESTDRIPAVQKKAILSALKVMGF